jgi:hypothetical protein
MQDGQTHKDETQTQLRALRHPLRQELIRTVFGMDEDVSPRELATRLKRSLPNVSYHVRVLHECEAITLVRTRPVRGSMQHFYRADEEFRNSQLVTLLLSLESPTPLA